MALIKSIKMRGLKWNDITDPSIKCGTSYSSLTV